VRPFAEFLVAMLPLDVSGRRAVDETLADWRHEAAEAQTVVGRVAAGVRGLTAVVVAVTVVAARDVASADTFRIAGAVAGAAVLMGIGFSYRRFEVQAALLAERGLNDASLFVMWASMLLPAISLCIPLALLAPPVRQVATRSLIGPCVVLTAISAFNLGWMTPHANQWFRETTWAIFRPAVPEPHVPRSLARGLAEYTVADLVREVGQGGAQSRRAAGQLNSRAVLLAMVPVCLILGVQARRLGIARRWRFGAGLLAWVTLSAGWFVGIVGGSVVVNLLVGQSEFLVLLRPWAVPFVCSSIALAIAWLAQQATSRQDDGQPIFN
jgi:hypothetical protein